MAKIHPAKPISQAVGPVFTVNDPLKFQNGGGHKIMAKKPVQDSSMSDLRPNKTLFSMPNADKPPKESKVMGTKKWFNPAKDYSGANASEGHMVDRDSCLKSSYEK